MTFKLIRNSFVPSLCLLGFISVLAPFPVLAGTTETPVTTVQSPAVWETYTVAGEGFSVQLPVLPAMSTYDNFIVKLNRNRRTRILGAYADGVVYAIYAYENLTPLRSLDDLIAEFPQNEPGNLKRDLTLNGVRGREYVFQQGELSGVTQFFLTEDHFYVFRAVGSSLGQRDVGISKFLASIQIGPTPEGKQLVDGPGMEPVADVSAAASGNDGRVLMAKEVTAKAKVITKPEPTYTEEARRNQITGTIVLRCVFSSSGVVTNLAAISKLPDGLTEKAIAAAKQIRFIPAQKDGRFVSMYIQLEYNFNLY